MPTNDIDIPKFGLKIISTIIVVVIIYLIAESVLRLVSPSTHLPDIGWLIVAIATIGFYGIRYMVKR